MFATSQTCPQTQKLCSVVALPSDRNPAARFRKQNNIDSWGVSNDEECKQLCKMLIKLLFINCIFPFVYSVVTKEDCDIRY